MIHPYRSASVCDGGTLALSGLTAEPNEAQDKGKGGPDTGYAYDGSEQTQAGTAQLAKPSNAHTTSSPSKSAALSQQDGRPAQARLCKRSRLFSPLSSSAVALLFMREGRNKQPSLRGAFTGSIHHRSLLGRCGFKWNKTFQRVEPRHRNFGDTREV